ncbi:hypothetical protein HS088_TW14G01141 [Tripterygium wilfordii]|uniref:Uncharacterized protein n=1 Tax=Tripterygium wilfordii TaxID=458696 RepID=A0A7J7CSA2_TRIWF|nr:hypothetical protein HS088_TW14G01141 [Tripterygium wilfordii]
MTCQVPKNIMLGHGSSLQRAILRPKLAVSNQSSRAFARNTAKMDGHNAEDPKQSTADMTAFVQNLLQQMQSRFQAMSESIITKNILTLVNFLLLHMPLPCE